MNMHILVLSLLGAVILGSALLLIRVLRYRYLKRTHDAVVERAAAQMRQTGIFLALGGTHATPEEVVRLQRQLRDWGYTGEIDGHLNTDMLDAFERMADARGVDIESEVLALFPESRSRDALPASIRQEQLLDTAQVRLKEARAALGHRIA